MTRKGFPLSKGNEPRERARENSSGQRSAPGVHVPRPASAEPTYERPRLVQALPQATTLTRAPQQQSTCTDTRRPPAALRTFCLHIIDTTSSPSTHRLLYKNADSCAHPVAPNSVGRALVSARAPWSPFGVRGTSPTSFRTRSPCRPSDSGSPASQLTSRARSAPATCVTAPRAMREAPPKEPATTQPAAHSRAHRVHRSSPWPLPTSSRHPVPARRRCAAPDLPHRLHRLSLAVELPRALRQSTGSTTSAHKTSCTATLAGDVPATTHPQPQPDVPTTDTPPGCCSSDSRVPLPSSDVPAVRRPSELSSPNSVRRREPASVAALERRTEPSPPGRRSFQCAARQGPRQCFPSPP